jgi:hypothetical protein
MVFMLERILSLTDFVKSIAGLILAVSALLAAIAALWKQIKELGEKLFRFRPRSRRNESTQTIAKPKIEPTQPEKASRDVGGSGFTFVKLLINIRSFTGILLLLVCATVVSLRFWPGPNPQTLRLGQLLTVAWHYYDQEKWDKVVVYANTAATRFEMLANETRETWNSDKKAPPKIGIVIEGGLTESDARQNNMYGLVNDVATAYFLMGKANRKLGRDKEAREAFQKVQEYPAAVTYDAMTREFWRTADGAKNELYQMDKVKS